MRFASRHGRQSAGVAAEIVACCDHALLDDDPASAGEALDRVRGLAVALGAEAGRLANLSPRDGAVAAADLAEVASGLADLIGALRPDGAAAVRVDAGAPVRVRDIPRRVLDDAARSALLPAALGREVAVSAFVEGDEGVLKVVVDDAEVARIRSPHGGPDPRSGGRPARVWRRALIAEDNPALRELETLALESMFSEVLVATDGEDAMETLLRLDGAVDVLVLDLRMPRRNGLEVLSEALHRWPSLAVVVASGAAPEGIAQSAVLAGARAVLVKPFRLAELRAVVRSVLDGATW